jgi:hypothetical protein
MQTSVPELGSEVIDISPLWRRAISLAMANPKPTPPVELERE